MFSGFIDVLYLDRHGDCHLVDLKTNFVTADELAAVAERYELQLSLYALAAERVLTKPPVELTLYFLRPQQEFSWPWNDASRRRTSDALNRAIKQSVFTAEQLPT